uniref:hemicentin-1-like isoform X2 n=1 Tax=Styela clava TaxID=7725 RepID=UPI00193AB29A|nr:hemicentin-1-like isoform X2 [Styela clava]
MWQWNEGSILSFKKWAPGMPRNSQKNRCLTTSYIGWENDDCEESKHKYLCESIRPHSLRMSSQNIIIFEARNTKIECTADGFPLPDVAWHKDNQRITDETEARIHQSAESAKSTLLINNARLEDAGTYRCYAINYANGTKGWTEGFAKLKVLPLGEPISEYDRFKGLEREFDEGDSNEQNIENNPEENACADYGWVPPVLITLFVVLILQFVFILCQRISAQNSTNNKAAIHGHTNIEVFHMGQEQNS